MKELITFNSVEKISDDMLYLGTNVVLRFTTVLGKKAKDGRRLPFHKEFTYPSNKYSDYNELRTIRRSFDYYMTIENIISNDEINKEYIQIRPDDIFMLRSYLKQASMWFISKEYEKLYAKKGSNIILIGKVANIVIPLRDKFIELEPIVVSKDYGDFKGIRLYLSSKNNYVDMTAEKFMGLVYTIESVNMFECSQNQLTYIQRPEFGTNEYSFNDKNIYTSDEELEMTIAKTERKIPTIQQSFFDKMRSLETS